MFAAELRLNPTGQRAAPRASIDAPGSFFSRDDHRSLCRIDNLSTTGARLRLYDQIDRRAEIELRLPGDVVRRARIVWVDELECGCAFDDPIPQEAVDALLATFGDDDIPSRSLPRSKS